MPARTDVAPIRQPCGHIACTRMKERSLARARPARRQIHLVYCRQGGAEVIFLVPSSANQKNLTLSALALLDGDCDSVIAETTRQRRENLELLDSSASPLSSHLKISTLSVTEPLTV